MVENVPSPQDIRKMEADRDISDKIFTVSMSGLEINTVLHAMNFATDTWVKHRDLLPHDIDLDALTSASDKLTQPVEEDFKKRCRNVG